MRIIVILLYFLFILSLLFLYKIESESEIESFKKKINLRPVIGVLTQPSHFRNKTESYIAASYVKFLEESGAQIVPLLYDYDKKTLKKLASKINGIFFTGGNSLIFNNQNKNKTNITEKNKFTIFGKKAKFLFNLVKKINSRGIYYPLFGICMGHEIITTVISKDFSILEAVDSENHVNKIEIYNKNSRIFTSLTENITNTLTTKKLLYFNHKKAIFKEKYDKNKNLKDNLRIVTYTHDNKGKKYISSFEGIKLPIYTAQFHAEKSAFEWNATQVINHSPEMIKISQLLSNFYVNETRKNENMFENQLELDKYSIYKSHSSRLQNIDFDEVYLFDPVNNEK